MYHLPIDCVVAITYSCNSRCIMCDIWKIKDFPELPAEEYKKLPTSLRDINISGGEPFMRKDLVEVVKIIHQTCPKARLVISSNGFLPTVVEEKMKEILQIDPNIGVAVSVDGVGEMHETIRQIPHAYDKSLDTIERLKKLGMKNLRLAFTILPENVKHLGLVYDDAMNRGVQFTLAFAQSSDHYFGGKHIENHPAADELKKQFTHIIKGELKSWNLKRWARAYFAYGLYLFGTKQKQILSNDPGNKFFFLDPRGNVYPSVVHNNIMSNVTDFSNWSDLWSSPQANEARQKVTASKIPVWMICTARTAIKKHPIQVGWWVIKNKFGRVKL